MKPRIVMFSAAGALLVGAIAFAIHIHHSDPPAQTGQTHAGRSSATAQGSAADAAVHRMPENPSGAASLHRPRVVRDPELVAKYGESRTNLARRVTGNLIDVMADFLEMGRSVSEMGLEDFLNDEEALPAELEEIVEKLALDDKQAGRATKIFEDHIKRMLLDVGQMVEGMKSNQSQLMEVLLAGDAFKQGKMKEEEFKSLRAGATRELQSAMGGIREDFRTRLDPLKNETVLRELDAMLEPSQRETFQSFLENRPVETLAENEEVGSGAPVNLTKAMDLEHLDWKVKSAKMLTSGAKSMLEGLGNLENGGGLFGK